MPLFKLPTTKTTRNQDKVIAGKSTVLKQAVPSLKGGTSLLARIEQIKQMVERNLGQYKEEYMCITDKEVLHDYISACIDNEYISIDTETDGLDPLLNIMAGPCINTRGQKPSYIPLNHISYITRQKVPGQLEAEFVRQEFHRLLAKKPYIDMFNAKFDIRVLRHFGLPEIYCTWDSYLGARILNDNEPVNKLKPLHQKYVLNGQGDAFTFEELFKGIPFTLIPYNVGYLYAAHDPHITTEYGDFQRQYLRPDSDREDMRHLYWVFNNIEMACVPVTADMEDNGVLIDLDYSNQLSSRYNKLLEEKVQNFYELLKPYKDKIDKARNGGAKIDNPVNMGSPTQLAILFYDILKVEPPDKGSPRGTGEEILVKMNNPIANAILEYRTMAKLVSTYIDKLPECVNPNDGKIHCNFHQYGANTGRYSSSEPNLQNIPSHNKDIRKMFTASNGYLLMSSDFSQQEPKCLAALCRKDGDPQMYNTFMEGKDLYSEIASKAFNKPYKECLEHFPKGSYIKQINKKWYYATEDDYDKIADGVNDTYNDGKERRTQAKSILLGVLYGRGESSIAEQLGCTKEKAKAIKKSVFQGFPAIKQFEQTSINMAKELGYVTTVCGRKRRLPDMQLDEYEFYWENGKELDTDILDFDSDLPFDDNGNPVEQDDTVPQAMQSKYIRKLKNVWKFSDKQKIIQEAKKEGIKIIDNEVKLADATRQCVNSRIQGSAADLTKLAMIKLNNNTKLKELGFRLLIPVHDEVIAECPEENIKECSKLLAQIMSQAAEEILEMSIKCDVVISKCWYGEEIEI